MSALDATHAFKMRYKVTENDDDTVDIHDVVIAVMGTWEDANGRRKKWGKAEFAEIMKADAEAHEQIDPVFKLGHVWSGPAYGWLSKFKLKGRQIISTIRQVPVELYKQIQQGRVRSLSPEIKDDWDEPSTKKVYKHVLDGLALLGIERRAMTSLPQLSSFEGQKRKTWTQEIMISPTKETDGLEPLGLVHRFEETDKEREEERKMGEELKAQEEALAEGLKNLAEQEKLLAKKAEQQKVALHTSKVNAGIQMLVSAKKLTPKDVDKVRARAMRIDDEEVFEFTAAGSKTNGTGVDEYFADLLEGPDAKLMDTNDAGKPKEKEADDRPPNEQLFEAVQARSEKDKISMEDAAAKIEHEQSELYGEYRQEFAVTGNAPRNEFAANRAAPSLIRKQ